MQTDNEVPNMTTKLEREIGGKPLKQKSVEQNRKGETTQPLFYKYLWTHVESL